MMTMPEPPATWKDSFIGAETLIIFKVPGGLG